MKRLKAYKIITKKGKYIKKKWALLAKKFNLDITISGIDALPNFNFNENHQILKTFITNEMLKKIYFAQLIFLYLLLIQKKN